MPFKETLRTPAAQNALAAVATGATVLISPAKFPRWARRGLSLARTTGTLGALLQDPDSPLNDALGLTPTQGRRDSVAAAGSALAAGTAGVALVTSGIGLKFDEKVEGFLMKKGVRHPRIWMALGAVGLVFIVKTVQDSQARKSDAQGSLAEKAKARLDQVKPADASDDEVPAKAAALADTAGSMPSTASQEPGAQPGDSAVDEDETREMAAGGVSTPTYDAMMAGTTSATTPHGAGDAPTAQPAGDVDETMTWNAVDADDAPSQPERDASPDAPSDEAPAHRADQDDSGEAPQTSSDDARSVTEETTRQERDAQQSSDQPAATGEPSAFEQQLARTTEEDLETPNTFDGGRQG